MENKKSALNDAVAEVIRGLRGERQMTIAQLAMASGVPVGTLTRILAGERDINVTQVGRIARAVGSPAHEIIRSAVNKIGGLDALVNERSVSAPASNVTPIRKRVEDMTVDEIESLGKKAATRDAEMDTDEHFD